MISINMAFGGMADTLQVRQDHDCTYLPYIGLRTQ